MYNTTVTLKKGEGRTLKAGGMWVFDNEIASILGTFENGDIVNIHDFDGYFIGYGYINTNSKITLRLLARRKDTVIDEAFFEQRVRDAWNYRKETIDTSSCRLIFGEADFLPGIVIDKFSDVLVVESLALGIDKWKLVIIDALKKVLAEDGIVIRGVYERSDAKVRLQEGMERYKGFIGEPFDTKVEIVENGVHYMVDVAERIVAEHIAQRADAQLLFQQPGPRLAYARDEFDVVVEIVRHIRPKYRNYRSNTFFVFVLYLPIFSSVCFVRGRISQIYPLNKCFEC